MVVMIPSPPALPSPAVLAPSRLAEHSPKGWAYVKHSLCGGTPAGTSPRVSPRLSPRTPPPVDLQATNFARVVKSLEALCAPLSPSAPSGRASDSPPATTKRVQFSVLKDAVRKAKAPRRAKAKPRHAADSAPVPPEVRWYPLRAVLYLHDVEGIAAEIARAGLDGVALHAVAHAVDKVVEPGRAGGAPLTAPEFNAVLKRLRRETQRWEMKEGALASAFQHFAAGGGGVDRSMMVEVADMYGMTPAVPDATTLDLRGFKQFFASTLAGVSAEQLFQDWGGLWHEDPAGCVVRINDLRAANTHAQVAPLLDLVQLLLGDTIDYVQFCIMVYAPLLTAEAGDDGVWAWLEGELRAARGVQRLLQTSAERVRVRAIYEGFHTGALSFRRAVAQLAGWVAAELETSPTASPARVSVKPSPAPCSPTGQDEQRLELLKQRALVASVCARSAAALRQGKQGAGGHPLASWARARELSRPLEAALGSPRALKLQEMCARPAGMAGAMPRLPSRVAARYPRSPASPVRAPTSLLDPAIAPEEESEGNSSSESTDARPGPDAAKQMKWSTRRAKLAVSVPVASVPDDGALQPPNHRLARAPAPPGSPRRNRTVWDTSQPGAAPASPRRQPTGQSPYWDVAPNEGAQVAEGARPLTLHNTVCRLRLSREPSVKEAFMRGRPRRTPQGCPPLPPRAPPSDGGGVDGKDTESRDVPERPSEDAASLHTAEFDVSEFEGEGSFCPPSPCTSLAPTTSVLTQASRQQGLRTEGSMLSRMFTASLAAGASRPGSSGTSPPSPLPSPSPSPSPSLSPLPSPSPSPSLLQSMLLPSPSPSPPPSPSPSPSPSPAETPDVPDVLQLSFAPEVLESIAPVNGDESDGDLSGASGFESSDDAADASDEEAEDLIPVSPFASPGTHSTVQAVKSPLRKAMEAQSVLVSPIASFNSIDSASAAPAPARARGAAPTKVPQGSVFQAAARQRGQQEEKASSSSSVQSGRPMRTQPYSAWLAAALRAMTGPVHEEAHRIAASGCPRSVHVTYTSLFRQHRLAHRERRVEEPWHRAFLDVLRRCPDSVPARAYAQSRRPRKRPLVQRPESKRQKP